MFHVKHLWRVKYMDWIKKPVAPCKGCNKRQLHCHANCAEYQQFYNDNEKYKADLRFFNAHDYYKEMCIKSAYFSKQKHKLKKWGMK